MMGDMFLEKIVKREATAGTRLLWVLVVAGAVLVLLTVLAIPYAMLYAPLAAILLFFLCRHLIQQLQVEFEYRMGGQELNIDILIGQRRRQPMLSLRAADIQSLRPAREFETAPPGNIALVYDAASSEQADGRWVAQFQKGKEVRILIFEPDDRMLDALRRYNPAAFTG